MKIPRTIRIRGVTYRVRVVKDMARAWLRCGGLGPWDGSPAFVVYKKAAIYLDSHMSDDTMCACFWHEVAHVVAYNLGRRFTEGEIDALGVMVRDIARAF